MRSIRNSRPDLPEYFPSAPLPDISQVCGVPMAVIDEDGRICSWNAALCAFSGYSGEELNGMPVQGLITKKRDGRPCQQTARSVLSTKDGPDVPVSCAKAPVPGTGRFALTLVSMEEEARLASELAAKTAELEKREEYIECFREGVFRMITDLDRSETELKGALKDLQETQVQLVQSSKMNALGELAASLVHEISQPLTVIRGLSHGMMRSMGEGTPFHDKMRLIGEAASRMERIVKHLKSFSRSEAPVFSPVDINNVVKDAFIILNEHLLSGSIETVLDLSPVPPAMGNANRLEQVVINLVTNARDAMADGGVLTIATRKEEEGGRPYIRLMVKDSGVGIPDEFLGKVFDPFFTTKAAGKGTGLGLSISLGIVREHKGDIKVESHSGRGTVFNVILPAMAG